MRHQRGFTLIELLIVVAIMGALMAIAIPSYQKSVQKGHRSTAEQLMLQIASLEQQYFLDARSYTAQLDSTGLHVPVNGDPWTCSTLTGDCTSTFYTVHVTVTTPVSGAPYYVISATPISTSTQASDGILYYNAKTDASYLLGSQVRTAGDYKW